jgi:arylsulfatase A-like enzyme/Tfp pilus assembly protein PilF
MRATPRRIGWLVAALAAASIALVVAATRAWPVAHGRSEAAGAAAPVATGPQAPQAPLNLLLVTLDTARADRFGAYGAADAVTPAFDGLAREGVQFTRALSPVPLTLPAHISLFTGRVPLQHGVHDNGSVLPAGKETTLPQILYRAGFRTGAFVGSYVLDRQWGLEPGFETYVDHFDPSELGPDGLAGIQRPGNEVVDAALGWLDGVADQRFFGWVHLYDPHRPYDPPEPYRTQFGGRPYDGELAFVDAQLARLRAFLERRGLLDRTVIVIAGDHGESLGEHGEVTHGFFVYDSVLHVPLVIRAPSQAMRGRRVESVVRSVDLLPTLAELLGVPAPPAMAGASLVPLMTGAASDLDLVAYSESLTPLLHYGWSDLRTVRLGSLKFIEAPKPELYDLTSDPGELHNLYDQRRADADRLARVLRGLETELGSAAPTPTTAPANATAAAAIDPDARARLASLGYVASGRGAARATSASTPDDHPRADPKDKIGVAARLFAANEQLGQPGADARVVGALEQVTMTDPEIVDAWLMLGSAALRAQQIDRAIAMYRRAWDLRQDYDLVAIDLARAYRAAGRDDLAIQTYERYLRLDPAHAYVRYQLGGLRLDRGELDAAQAILTDLSQRHAGFALAHVALGVVSAKRRDLASAARQFREALAIDPHVRLAHLNLALLAEQQGDLSAALDNCQQERALNPRSYAAAQCVARLQGAIGVQP